MLYRHMLIDVVIAGTLGLMKWYCIWVTTFGVAPWVTLGINQSLGSQWRSTKGGYQSPQQSAG